MDEKRHQYIPALRFGWLTRLYDPVIRWTMREDLFKPRLVEQVGMQPGHRVLGLGCGTATLTILLKQRQPQSTVVGLDGDPVVLARAREKVVQTGVDVVFDQGMAYQLPYPDRSFDRVVASQLLHHLTSDTKRRALRETFRVLKPGLCLAHRALVGRSLRARERNGARADSRGGIYSRGGNGPLHDRVRDTCPHSLGQTRERSGRY